jgi:rod shape-determining protein MreD
MKKFERLGYLLKIIGKAAAIILLAMFQTSFIAALPWPFNYFNFVLSVLIFITAILNFRQALWFAFFSGLILDTFSFSGFGTIAAILILVAIIINFLFRNFFTNRSLYSLVILGLIGNGIYILSLLIFNFLFFIFGATDNLEKFFSRENIFGLGWQIVFGVLFLAILFLLFNFLSKKLKSVFLDAG